MITGFDRKEFEQMACEIVASLLHQTRADGVGRRLPLVILIEACCAALAEHSRAGESAEILMKKLQPFCLSGFQRGFDAANANRKADLDAEPWTPFMEVVG